MEHSPHEETDVNFSRFVVSVTDESGTFLLPVFSVNMVQYPVVIEENGDTRGLVTSDLLQSGFELVTSTLREEAISSARQAMPKTGKCWINLSPETVEVVVRIGQEQSSLAIAPIGVSDPIDMTFRRSASNGCVLLVSTGGFEYDENWEITNFAEAVTRGSVVAGKVPIRKVF